jgi:hypothetical protein
MQRTGDFRGNQYDAQENKDIVIRMVSWNPFSSDVHNSPTLPSTSSSTQLGLQSYVRSPVKFEGELSPPIPFWCTLELSRRLRPYVNICKANGKFRTASGAICTVPRCLPKHAPDQQIPSHALI